jgi:hypothetical protein
MADLIHLEEEEEPHHAPARTTPQGTLALTVVGQHEERDVRMRPILSWFGGLAIGTMLATILLLGVYFLILQMEASRDRVASPMLRPKSAPPPLPRVLPNPADTPKDGNPVALAPWNWSRAELGKEDAKLAEIGLIDPATRAPALPEKGLAAVVTVREGEDPKSLVQPRPSDASGGTTTENGLR